MTGMFYEYTEARHRAAVQHALGGEVWWEEREHDGLWLYWRPDGHEEVISVPYRPLLEDFDPVEWAESMRAGWQKKGVYL